MAALLLCGGVLTCRVTLANGTLELRSRRAAGAPAVAAVKKGNNKTTSKGRPVQRRSRKATAKSGSSKAAPNEATKTVPAQNPVPASPAILKYDLTSSEKSSADESLLYEEVKVNFVISEACALIRFLDSVSERPHTTNWIPEWYFKHRGGDTSKDKKLIADYRNLMDNSQREFSDESGRQQDLNQRILSLSAQCQSMPELLTKIKSLFKANEYTKIKSVLEHFDPIFRALIWEQSLPVLEKQLTEYKDWATKSKMGERMSAVKRFMKAPWVKGLPITVVLVPIPKPDMKHASHSGESLGKVQLVEMLPDSTFKNDADVVFHEACHALWHTRKDQDKVRRDFEKFNAYTAYSELDEGMATALGQGWFAKMAFAKTPKSWYNDPITNTYGHALYPIVKDYLKNEKSIDEEFAKKAAAVFKKNFPDTDGLDMTSFFEIFCDGLSEITHFHQELRIALPRLKSLSMSSPIDNAESMSSFRNSGNRHSAVLISKSKLSNLVDWGVPAEKVEQLRAAKDPLAFKIGQKEVIFCVADTTDEQQRMLFSVLSKKKWPKTDD